MSSRRTVIQTLVGITGVAAGAAAQQSKHQHADPGVEQPAIKPTIADKKPRKPGFFTAAEFAMVDALTELIIPRTDTPGARDAGVAWIIDQGATKDAKRQSSWRKGLTSLDAQSGKKFGAAFAKATAAQQTELLTELSNAKDPFFELAKSATIDAYYSTKEGLAVELGWHGNTFLPKFTGCTHPEHQA